MFPCIFRFRFFCYNKLKHIFTLLSGFCHFSLFFPFSQHATHPLRVCGACKFSMWVYTDVRKSYCFKFCTFYWSSVWISEQPHDVFKTKKKSLQKLTHFPFPTIGHKAKEANKRWWNILTKLFFNAVRRIEKCRPRNGPLNASINDLRTTA